MTALPNAAGERGAQTQPAARRCSLRDRRLALQSGSRPLGIAASRGGLLRASQRDTPSAAVAITVPGGPLRPQMVLMALLAALPEPRQLQSPQGDIVAGCHGRPQGGPWGRSEVGIQILSESVSLHRVILFFAAVYLRICLKLENQRVD